MRALKIKWLPKGTLLHLQKYQSDVDALPTFSARVEKAKVDFKKYNTTNNSTFKVIRAYLAKMSGDTIRCHYCEDSNANQIEHFYPKNFYPEKCFVWENYCYACGPCNQPKSNSFAIFDALSGKELNLKTIAKNTQPPPGKALLIDPRSEEPLDYLFLDTLDTFRFVPLQEDNEQNARRAEYTIDVLGLNSRSHLVRARQVAFVNYTSRLSAYIGQKKSGMAPDQLTVLINSLKNEHHQTVWLEMIRQRGLHPHLDEMFHYAPEALTWHQD